MSHKTRAPPLRAALRYFSGLIKMLDGAWLARNPPARKGQREG
jgi:hypothetical protein